MAVLQKAKQKEEWCNMGGIANNPQAGNPFQQPAPGMMGSPFGSMGTPYLPNMVNNAQQTAPGMMGSPFDSMGTPPTGPVDMSGLDLSAGMPAGNPGFPQQPQGYSGGFGNQLNDLINRGGMLFQGFNSAGTNAGPLISPFLTGMRNAGQPQQPRPSVIQPRPQGPKYGQRPQRGPVPRDITPITLQQGLGGLGTLNKLR